MEEEEGEEDKEEEEEEEKKVDLPKGQNTNSTSKRRIALCVTGHLQGLCPLRSILAYSGYCKLGRPASH